MFVKYEGCTVALAVEVVGLMMLLRIRALYTKHKWITWGLGFLLVCETAMNVWLISNGEPVIHNPSSGIHGGCFYQFMELFADRLASACSMVFDPSIIIFGLTLYRTVPPIRRKEASYIIKRLLEDGLLYYSVIFSVTLVLTIMIIAAPPGTKNICAQLEQLITVAMMSRITLNLKKAGGIVFAEPFPSVPPTPGTPNMTNVSVDVPFREDYELQPIQRPRPILMTDSTFGPDRV
ncbi:hypothetical protein BDQ17DRAFT_1334322 [Cyathus striatus]|nr:hypothetical protein BDQ17DRAFT_1334322 [Cyathus striatus]